jgi:ABC-type Fe3+/spermidine/putrescine transport system ATPase subunit
MAHAASTSGLDDASDVHVRAVGLTKSFGGADAPAVHDLHLEIARGEMFGLLGPSGCGKSTTLNMLAGFLEPSAGDVLIDGVRVNEVPSYRRGVALVFQNYALFPHLTAADNVAFGLKVRRTPRAVQRRRVDELLELVGLARSADKYPAQLSGGQQQRVAIARALAVDPSVILLDEPLSNLDARLRTEMRIELKRILREAGVTVVLVTHDQSEAFSVCDRVALMFGGRLETVSAPRELYLRPASRAAAEFIGEGTFFPGRVTVARADGGVDVRLDDGPTVAAAALDPVEPPADGAVFVRPELVRLTAPDDPRALLHGSVADVSHLGETIAYLVQTAARPVHHKTLSTEAEHRLGEAVGVTWDPADGLFFPRTGAR